MRKFDKSKLSQEAFCDAHGLTLGTFRSWLYRLRREGREGSSAAPKFVEVVAHKSASSHACAVIVGHAELRFSHLPDAAFLGALLSVAGGEAQ
ncbi:MAG TPA: hypothetical protein VF331_05915 [Polyangiales bacterium]